MLDATVRRSFRVGRTGLKCANEQRRRGDVPTVRRLLPSGAIRRGERNSDPSHSLLYADFML